MAQTAERSASSRSGSASTRCSSIRRRPVTPAVALGDDGPGAGARYAAAATSRILLGTGIVILPLRNPVILAKELATVDVLSQGRLVVGIGVGYVPGEYDAIGVPFAHGADGPTSGSTRSARSGVTSSPSSRATSHRSAASSAARSRSVPVARRSSPAGCRPRPGGGRWPAARAGTASSRTSRTPGPASPSSTASPGGRPPGRAGPARDHHYAPPGPDRRSTPCGATRTSASTAWSVLQDFGDMAGGPDAVRRGKFLDEMAACAERLDIR